MKKNLLSGLMLALVFMSCQNEEKSEAETKVTVKHSSEIIWEKLNPARGDQSPKAGTIWGNRNGTEATGFLAEFKDGFSSPAHIHNVTYRAVVLSGWVHNDDPEAEKMWMPTGSFWTQPAGEAHITAARGSSTIAYVEIDKGPYLVKPTEEAFDEGERPVNIDASNIVWQNASESEYVKNTEAEIAFLWKNKELKGSLIRIPANFSGKIQSEGSIFHAVVIQGNPIYQLKKEKTSLDPGSYFSSEGKTNHLLSTSDGESSTLYIRSNGAFTVSN